MEIEANSSKVPNFQSARKLEVDLELQNLVLKPLVFEVCEEVKRVICVFLSKLSQF